MTSQDLRYLTARVFLPSSDKIWVEGQRLIYYLMVSLQGELVVDARL